MMKRFMACLVLLVITFPAFAADNDSTSAFDRVEETKTLRCGYIPYEPYIIKGFDGSPLKGITVEYMNEAAKRAGYSIDWAEEVNVDQIVPALNYGRVDAICVPCTPDKNWDTLLEFGATVGALPYYVYVREESTLTKDDLKTAKFAVTDGYALTDITKKNFPQASYLSLGQMTSVAEMYDQLRYKKVQAHVNEHVSASNYMRNNPGIIKRFSDKPLLATRMFLPSRKGDGRMTAFMKAVFDESVAGNHDVLKNLMIKYNVPEDAMVLGDQCSNTIETEDGWKICGEIEGVGMTDKKTTIEIESELKEKP